LRRAVGLRIVDAKSSAISASLSIQGFRDLVVAHQSRVFSIAFRIVGDRGIAEEVAQDVFLALYRNLEHMESDEHLLAWLRRVTVHRATDACRRRASRVDFTAEEFHEERTPVASGSASSSVLSGRIEQLVAGLSAIQRAVLLLRYQEDMLPMEISTTLSMPLATVKSHLQRALKQLRVQAARSQKEVSHG